MGKKRRKPSKIGNLKEKFRSAAFYTKREIFRSFKSYTSKESYRSIASPDASTVTISRIIGNDLYPRHADGQAIENLNFILENEEDFPNCRKVFVINRMFDPDTEKQAIDQVLAKGHTLLVLPFVDQNYAKQEFNQDILDEEPYPSDGSEIPMYKGKDVERRLLACADKIRYAMNINGARNAALDDGRKHSEWTLLLDGSCYISGKAYGQLQRELYSRPVTPYVVVPMMRLQSNSLALTVDPVCNSDEEPQIAFHQDSMEYFDERYPYGMRDKSSLLDRIGIPGKWSHSREWTELPKRNDDCPHRYYYKYSKTCVFRLSSGAQGGYLESSAAQRERYRSRNKAIFQSLAMLDSRVQKVVDSGAKEVLAQ